ncbi:MAG: SulP family inorganic anion transporter [Cyanobacteriota bacterium]
MDKLFSNLKSDLPAGLVVSLVAIPLCLGTALASGAPLFSGIISGIIGGIVVGYLSKSNTSVSGPAAGLAAIVLTSINELGAFEIFLLSVVFSGIMQIVLGVLKAGGISNFFPSSVINGLLASIGIVIIMKQIPHAVGYDSTLEGDFSFIQNDGQNTFSELIHMFTHFNFGALIISIVSILILVSWEKTPLKKINFLPASLIAVVMSIILNEFVLINYHELFLSGDRLVTIPIANNLSEFFNLFTLPDFLKFLIQMYIK